jgi:hypothetical protein
MRCTQKLCARPGLFSCDGCGEERCANHCKACDDCGKTLCHSLDSLCYSAHECKPLSEAEEIFCETMVERVDKIAQKHVTVH